MAWYIWWNSLISPVCLCMIRAGWSRCQLTDTPRCPIAAGSGPTLPQAPPRCTAPVLCGSHSEWSPGSTGYKGVTYAVCLLKYSHVRGDAVLRMDHHSINNVLSGVVLRQGSVGKRKTLGWLGNPTAPVWISVRNKSAKLVLRIISNQSNYCYWVHTNHQE